MQLDSFVEFPTTSPFDNKTKEKKTKQTGLLTAVIVWREVCSCMECLLLFEFEFEFGNSFFFFVFKYQSKEKISFLIWYFTPRI